MKKKIVSWLLIATMTLSLAACGGSEEPAEETAQAEDATEENESVEVDENLLTMEITIPADFMEGTTQEDLNGSVKENGFISATLNEDGSVTYVMTKGKHKEFMASMTDEFNTSLAEMIESEDYPNITNIDANPDFTSFAVTTKSTELDMNESFSVLAFYMYGGLYNSFNGASIDNIHVDFINADSGDVIETWDSKDLEEAE